jgi:hypothetical protein
MYLVLGEFNKIFHYHFLAAMKVVHHNTQDAKLKTLRK